MHRKTVEVSLATIKWNLMLFSLLSFQILLKKDGKDNLLVLTEDRLVFKANIVYTAFIMSYTVGVM